MTNHDKRTIIGQLKTIGSLDYGSVITGDEFRDVFCISMPKFGTRQDFDSVALEELTYSSFVRDVLLNEGKYFKYEKGNYRVLLPSENAGQVMAYMSQADTKLKRGLKLNKNTPVDYKINCQEEARGMMKTLNLRSSD